MKIEAVDLFCGVGGLTYGLNQAGIKVLAGVDVDAGCRYAYEENNQATFLTEDIVKLDAETIQGAYTQKADYKILVGCAPCQPFSTHANKHKDRRENDTRWNLVGTFFDHVDAARPDVISMENVPGLVRQGVFKDFVTNLTNIGYKVSYSVVFGPDYGIPQTRKRLVLLASRHGEIKLISPTHSKERAVTVRDMISHLDPIEQGKCSSKDPLHAASELSDLNYQRILASKPGGTWKDWDESLRLECHKKSSGSSYTAVYGRLKWDAPASTITTQFHRFGTGRFGHPEQHRALSVREGALLQTFPQNYQFLPEGAELNFTQLCRQIGNAVPPRLGKVIGQSIKRHLSLI